MISKNRISHIKALQQKKQRDLEKLFLAEGVKAVCELLEEQAGSVEEIFALPDFVNERRILLQTSGVKYTEINEAELQRISALKTPNAVLAVCRYFENSSPDFDFLSEFSLYLDDIRDPGNFGTMIRLADWFGIKKIFCSESSCDFYNPKVIQATMGAFLRVRVTYVTLGQLLSEQPKVRVYGAILKGKNIYAEKLSPGIILIGNESAGISAENLKLVTDPISIPSHHGSGTESLNAAMAASIITAEFFRQLKCS